MDFNKTSKCDTIRSTVVAAYKSVLYSTVPNNPFDVSERKNVKSNLGVQQFVSVDHQLPNMYFIHRPIKGNLDT